MADIELIVKIPEELAEKGHWYTDEEMWTVIKAAQNGTPIPDNATNGEWVDVNERLPEEETDVLICNSKGQIEVSCGSTFDDGTWEWYTSGWHYGEIIAWMPLPAPYQKGGKE